MFAFTVLVALVVVAVASAGVSMQNSKVSASLKEQSYGLEGLNFNVAIPFNIKDYVVGIRYKVKETLFGEGALDSLFAKKSFDVADGKVSVTADFDVSDKSVGLAADWSGMDNTLSVSASGNSVDKLTNVGFSKIMDVLEDKKVKFAATYDLLKQKYGTTTTVSASDNVKVTVGYSGDDPKVSMEYTIDSQNSITPSITGAGAAADITYTRSWEGGSLASTVDMKKNLGLTWKDTGCAGKWTTTANIPLEDRAATSVSLSRDWDM